MTIANDLQTEMRTFFAKKKQGLKDVAGGEPGVKQEEDGDAAAQVLPEEDFMEVDGDGTGLKT